MHAHTNTLQLRMERGVNVRAGGQLEGFNNDARG